jgi:hypothetical protein
MYKGRKCGKRKQNKKLRVVHYPRLMGEGIRAGPTGEGKKRRSKRVVEGWTGESRKKNKRNGRYNIGTDGVCVVALAVESSSGVGAEEATQVT